MDQKHRETLNSCCEEIIPKINIIKLWPKLLQNKIFNRDDVNISRWEKNLTEEATIRDIYLTIKTRGPYAFNRFLVSLSQSSHEDLADILEERRTTLFNNDDEQRDINHEITKDNNIKTEITKDNNIKTEITKDNNIKEPIYVETEEGPQGDFFRNIQVLEKPLQISVRKATSFLDDAAYENVQTYPMRSKPHGLVLIITNIDYAHPDKEPRTSAIYDELNLKQLFEQMGFHVFSFCNLTAQEMLNEIKEFSKHKDLRKVDSCFVIISSHGNISTQYEITEIEGVEKHNLDTIQSRKTILCVDILSYFTAENCPHLAGKPKVFIFQLCRGAKKQKSVKEPRYTTDISNFQQPLDEMIHFRRNNREMLRSYEDMLLVYATLPGYVAFRDTITGSWFIQILCEVFMKYAHKAHLQDLLNMVDERLKIQRTNGGECQTLTVTSIGFNKHCYLNPGLFQQT
ncbi:caspase-6 isoform X1 [Frieseomelitta varia]|uniref:caspase-6 isoform X1 n=1 Tax=Frieseomelitta varia TaxID=561572 RepID=UPI001CB6A03C|nr:caspase-6 isoform X1 [Frieseomelitta varia]